MKMLWNPRRRADEAERLQFNFIEARKRGCEKRVLKRRASLGRLVI
jgi:hypothetical protein